MCKQGEVQWCNKGCGGAIRDVQAGGHVIRDVQAGGGVMKDMQAGGGAMV